MEFDQFEVKLEKGDRLLLASDGITECPNPEGGMLGEEGFDAMMRELESKTGPDMLETLLWLLSDYAGDAGFPDDVSVALYEHAK